MVLVTPITLSISWESPRIRGGTVAYFTAYAFPLVTETSTRKRRQAENPATLKMVKLAINNKITILPVNGAL